MWLRNFDNFMMSVLMQQTSAINIYSSFSELGTDVNAYGDGHLNGKTTLGTTTLFDIGTAYSNSSSSDVFYPPIVWNGYAICFGDGSVEVTYDDYKLSGNMMLPASSRSIRENSFQYNEETEKWERIIVIVYANTSSTTKIVREWGIWREQNAVTAGDYGVNDSTILLYREVFSDPITIPPDTTVEITLTIECPMPNRP